MTLYEGGCECGLLRYTMRGEPIFVNCCHCRDCQKITGSAFAINGLVETSRLELSMGGAEQEPLTGEARCDSCGTLLWAEHRLFGNRIKFVRLGTLDESERLSPDAHFFVRSKHSWIVIPDDVPQFETLPTSQDAPLMSPDAKARLEAARRT